MSLGYNSEPKDLGFICMLIVFRPGRGSAELSGKIQKVLMHIFRLSI